MYVNAASVRLMDSWNSLRLHDMTAGVGLVPVWCQFNTPSTRGATAEFFGPIRTTGSMEGAAGTDRAEMRH